AHREVGLRRDAAAFGTPRRRVRRPLSADPALRSFGCRCRAHRSGHAGARAHRAAAHASADGEGDAASDGQADAASDAQTNDLSLSKGDSDGSSDHFGHNYTPTDTNSDVDSALTRPF